MTHQLMLLVFRSMHRKKYFLTKKRFCEIYSTSLLQINLLGPFAQKPCSKIPHYAKCRIFSIVKEGILVAKLFQYSICQSYTCMCILTKLFTLMSFLWQKSNKFSCIHVQQTPCSVCSPEICPSQIKSKNIMSKRAYPVLMLINTSSTHIQLDYTYTRV